MGYSGFGTEGIEEELQSQFPSMVDPADRHGRDEEEEGAATRRWLTSATGKINVLMGTQMVAKGLNFPGVKLVGIVNADTGLQTPGFQGRRADIQPARAGVRQGGTRSIPDGKVLIQTFRPAPRPY